MVGTAVVAVDLRVEVEGEPTEPGEREPVELEDPSSFLSVVLGSAAGAADASGPAVVAFGPVAATFGLAVAVAAIAIEAAAR